MAISPMFQNDVPLGRRTTEPNYLKRNNNNNNMVLSVEPMLQFRGAKGTLITKTKDIEGEEEHVNGKNRSSATHVSGNLRRLCKQGELKKALDLLNVMDKLGIRAESSVYGALLQGCVNKKALPEGKLVHAHMTDNEFSPDIFLWNKLVIMYANCGSLVDARRVMDEMPERNVVSWTAMISGYSRHGFNEEALTLYYQMRRTGTQPNHFTFASVLPACANLATLKDGKQVHGHVIRCGFQFNIFVASAIVDMYAKCGSIDHARQMFDKMPERNAVSWNTMIAACTKHGYDGESLAMYYRMLETGIQPNQFTFASVLLACANLAALKHGKEVHENINRLGFQSDIFVGSALMDMYAKCGSMEDACRVFDKSPERNVVSWSVMIAGYAQNGYADEALKLFQKMPERDVVSWNTMIGGYAQNGHFQEALKLYRQMQLTGVKSNAVTFASVLPACANLAVLNHGKEVHANIIRSEFRSEIFLGNTLVDMYAKCGSVADARQVFDKMAERNVVSWTAMIVGYAMHGCGKEAVQLFEQMQHSGTKPDHATFVGVLSACCHAGLVDDGWQYFDSMIRDYHIVPEVEHYCCMVDLLGRAGHLNEAQDFINKMPIKPNSVVWRSLLGACRVHGNIELGKRVAEHLFELEPEKGANYVLLSNIYAVAGMWDNVEKVRKLMKDRGIQKSPGCSWIEVNNKVYFFLAGDRSNPRADEIYAELERLSGQMKEAGYVPNTNLVSHDVEEEQKEQILCHHREKLSIAFGLIHTSPNTYLEHRMLPSVR